VIRYTLTCNDDHRFDSWFQSSDAFDVLAASGHLACAVCGSKDVSRALMAPSVPAKGNNTDLRDPLSDAEAAISEMRDHIAANSDDVGLSFAQEARKMHDGDVPERAIHGTAKLEDAKKLVEDGVPVTPLPFLPKRKTN
jgi:hypothetical protein